MKKILFLSKALFLIIVIPLIAFCTCAEAGATGLSDDSIAYSETMPDEYFGFIDALPEGVADALPDGLYSGDADDILGAANKMSDLGYIFSAILSAVGLELGGCTRLLATLIGIILISAVLNTVRKSIGGATADIVGFCVRLVMFSAIVAQGTSVIKNIQLYFTQLNTLTAAAIPVMGALYVAGGNISRAAVNEGLFSVFLAVCEYISASTVLPVFGLCLAFALLDAFSGSVRLDVISALIKKYYTSFLGFIMTALSISLAMQNSLAGRTDSLSMKGIKYLVGNSIPVVGPAISSTLGTVAAGSDILRGAFGICGIILLLLLLLPSLINILLHRAVFQISATTASVLGCDGESKLLGEIVSLYGYLAAAVSICSAVFVIAFAVFSHGASAVIQ